MELGYIVVYDVDFSDSLTILYERGNETSGGEFDVQRVDKTEIEGFINCSIGIVSEKAWFETFLSLYKFI